MPKEDIEHFCPASREDWRQWLHSHHDSKQSVWLVSHKKNSGKVSIPWSDTVDEALCYGWIDSTRVSINSEQFRQLFTRRKPKSVWSKINKEKVQRLISEGLMTKAGLATVEIAKKNGSWSLLDEVEKLTIPDDLEKAFKAHKGAKDYFDSLSKSVKKMMLYWLVMAKRPETREKRINEIAVLAGKKTRPKQFG